MDQDLLVASGHRLIDLLTEDRIPPRAVLWVHNPDTDTWRLWIVPHPSVRDKKEFYRRLAVLVSGNRSSLHGLDGSDVEMIAEHHPAVTALKSILTVEVASSVHIDHNMLGGFYIPEGIILLLH
jgi:hypothetical protein